MVMCIEYRSEKEKEFSSLLGILGYCGHDSSLNQLRVSASMAGMLRGFATGVLLPALAVCAAAALEDDTVVELPEADARAASASSAAAAEQASPSPQELVAARQVHEERPEPPAAEDAHVVSQSRMFSVSGGEGLRMGAIANHADETYRRVCNLLGVEDKWKYAISIRLLGQQSDPPRANPIRTRIAVLGGEPNFQIRIYPGGGIDLNRLTNAIISMVLYERSLREMNPNSFPETMNLPDWLVTGMQQAILWKRGRADRRLYRNLFNRAEMLSPQEIIATAEPWKLDAGSRQVYEVSCGVLIMGLINQPNGQIALRDLLADAATVEGTPQEIIGRYFHELSLDDNLLSKWWALELASLSAQRASEALSPLDTERQLVEALTVLTFDEETQLPKAFSIEDTYALVRLHGWQAKVRGNIEKLMALSYTCFPGYRFIITEYCQSIARLINGASPDEVQNTLGPLREMRQAYVQASIRGRDYLDWYEITHLGEKGSGSFDAYLEAMALLRRKQDGVETPISRYLDDIELLHTLSEGEPLPEHLQPAPRQRHVPQEP